MSEYVGELFTVKDKVAVITGGGGFLCGTMACALAKSGVSVVIVDNDKKRVDEKVSEIKKDGGKVVGVVSGVTTKEEHAQVLDKASLEFGKVDILINGAGINAPTPFLDIPLDEWNSIIEVHLTGTFLGCQVFGEHMLKNGSGSIINISSASAGPPLSKAFAYSVAKSGVKNITQNIAREWATKGVRVNALRPGFFPTEWSKKNFITKEREAAILGHTAMKRYGKPSELIGAVIWLCSDAASFVTGAEIAVDGGFSSMTI
ncbi:MAG: SDR family oxidoreductase [Candidatus Omnitrophica bacterium]|nr:SDR family oxidoreductase [Candidatus Omnitrophota bacterium]